jgi:hypothetical protein
MNRKTEAEKIFDMVFGRGRWPTDDPVIRERIKLDRRAWRAAREAGMLAKKVRQCKLDESVSVFQLMDKKANGYWNIRQGLFTPAQVIEECKKGPSNGSTDDDCYSWLLDVPCVSLYA